MTDRNRSLQVFVQLLSRHWKWMVAGSLFGLIATTATVGLLALSGWFLSAAAFAGLSTTAAQTFNYFFPSIGVRIFAISRTLARYAERVVSHDATFRILESLRIWFYERIEPLAPARLMRYRSGDILNRVLADIDALDNLYVRVLSPSLVAGILVAGLTVFLSLFDPLIALTTLGWLVVAGFGLPAAAGIAGAAAGQAIVPSDDAVAHPNRRRHPGIAGIADFQSPPGLPGPNGSRQPQSAGRAAAHEPHPGCFIRRDHTHLRFSRSIGLVSRRGAGQQRRASRCQPGHDCIDRPGCLRRPDAAAFSLSIHRSHAGSRPRVAGSGRFRAAGDVSGEFPCPPCIAST